MSTREKVLSEIAVIPDNRLMQLHNLIKNFIDNIYNSSEDSEYFDEEIKNELLKEGYSGDDFVIEFYKRRAKIKPAVQNLLEQIKKDLSSGVKYADFDEVFGE
jgi:hypothetical protein